MPPNRILLVENQKTQFEKIFRILNAGEIEVRPSLEEYDHFMDWVRIWANPGYNQTYQDQMFARLQALITKEAIRLFILDYKLSGSKDGRTGLGLAESLTKSCQVNPKHIILLSRLPRNSPELEAEWVLVDQYWWIEKGYGGNTVLEENYIEKYIKTKVIELLGAGDEISKMLEELKKDPTIKSAGIWDKFLVLHDASPRGQVEEELIRFLYLKLVEEGGKNSSPFKIEKRLEEYIANKKSVR